MSSPRRALRRGLVLGAVGLVGLLAACSASAHPQTIFDPVTDYGRTLDELFHSIFWWTIWILVVVELGIVWLVIRFRDRPGAEDPKQIHGNNKLELIWTLVPAVIVVAITVPSVKTIFQTYQKAPQGALIVEAIGHQWWWEFRYPQYDGARTSNQLYLPVGRPVEMKLSSVDVIHSWWVPRLGGKRDNFPIPAIPSGAKEPTRYHRLLFTVEEPGEYSGQCAEYCGTSHALMRMRVMAVQPDEFAKVIAQFQGKAPAPAGVQTAATQTQAASVVALGSAGGQDSAQAQPAAPPKPGAPPEGTLERQGYDVFTTHACVACHRIAGTSAVGQIGPDLTKVGARWAIGAGTLDNTQQNIQTWIHNPQAVKPGALMPGTKTSGGGLPPTGLTDEQVRQVAAYLSSLK